MAPQPYNPSQIESFDFKADIPMRLRIEQGIRVTQPCSSASQAISEDLDLYLKVWQPSCGGWSWKFQIAAVLSDLLKF